MGGASSSQTQTHHRQLAEVISDVAEAISDDGDLRKFGSELHLSHSTISKAIVKNWEHTSRSAHGSETMLRKWVKQFKRPDLLLPTLKAALGRAGLTEIAERFFPGVGGNLTLQSHFSRSQSAPLPGTRSGGNPRLLRQFSRRRKDTAHRTNSGGHGAMPDDIKRLKEQLKKRYIQKYGNIKTSPVDPDSSKPLRNIFVSLVLILRSSTSLFGIDMSIETDKLYKLITKNTTEGIFTRFAFLGKVGVGKSTLFSKIALDWALGDCLQDVDLLFLESFQDMENKQSFGNIVMNHFPEMTVIRGDRIDQYIRDNQRKVAILITDLNEKKMDLTVQNGENAVVSIVRGDRYAETPVLITTLPYVVDLIKGDDNIRQKYTLIEVQGFSRKGSRNYIDQFFKHNIDSAASLHQYIKSNAQISEYLTPYPIFCSMLCYVWEKVLTQETLKKLETFSQVFKEICFSLGEQYFSKRRGRTQEYQADMRKVSDTIRAVGKVAFDGLMENQHIFTEEEMESCKDDALTACDMGILGRERRLVSREKRQNDGKPFMEEFYFPHELLQEYAASSYLESLFRNDPLAFNRILTDRVLRDYKKFKYVLFFTAAHGGKVATSVMKALCQRVSDINFIMEVAFECHDKDALDPCKNLLILNRSLVPGHSTQHSFLATVFALETYGKEVIEEVKHVPSDFTPDAMMMYSDKIVDYSRAVFNMPNVRSLQLANNNLESEIFFSTMAAKAEKSQITTLRHERGRLDQASSSHYATAIVSMPHLQHLELCDVELSSNDFYPKIADGASKSRILSLKHEGGSLSPDASAKYAKAIVSMPKLQTLELSDVKLKDEFYPQLADGASKSRIVTLKHEGGKLGKDASAQYSNAILTMPNLQDLELCNVKLSDDFYQPAMATKASNTKIKKLKHVGGTLGSNASSQYAKSLSSMEYLQSLELENVKLHDEFYKRAATEAAQSNVEVLRHADAELSSVASSYHAQGLFSMPNLRSLELDRLKLSPKFFSTMCEKSSTSEITSLRHVNGDLSPQSSYNYANGLFSMPQLRSLELIRMKLSDSFFTQMSSEASNSKIEKLKQTDADLSHDASSHYARGLCSMPKLQSLELHNVKLKDEFSASLAAGPSRPKIQTLVMKMCTVNQSILQAFLSLPRLQSLTLVDNIDLPDSRNYRRTPTLGITSVNDLSLDCRSVADLWKLGLHTSCHRVKKLTLYFYDEDLDSSDTITTACTPFKYLTELHINWQRLFDPVKFYNTLRTSCPRLTKLSLTRIKIFNEKATEIIKSLKTLPYLTILEMDSCWTDKYLDPIIAQVNNQSRLNVTVTHGPEDPSEVI